MMNRGDIKLVIDRCIAYDVPDAAELIESLAQQLATTNTAFDVVQKDCWNLTEKVIPNLRQQLDARDHFVPDTFDGNDICDAWAGLPVEFFNPGPNFGCLK